MKIIEADLKVVWRTVKEVIPLVWAALVDVLKKMGAESATDSAE